MYGGDRIVTCSWMVKIGFWKLDSIKLPKTHVNNIIIFISYSSCPRTSTGKINYQKHILNFVWMASVWSCSSDQPARIIIDCYCSSFIHPSLNALIRYTDFKNGGSWVIWCYRVVKKIEIKMYKVHQSTLIRRDQ